jgi:hypothetical protein
LTIECGLCHAQLGLGCGQTSGRRIKLRLLLGRIEARQNIAGIDVGTDIDQSCDHPPAHTKGKISAEAGLDLASQGEGSLSVPRLHDFGVHERGVLDCGGGAVIASSQWGRQKRERERSTEVSQNSLRERIG